MVTTQRVKHSVFFASVAAKKDNGKHTKTDPVGNASHKHWNPKSEAGSSFCSTDGTFSIWSNRAM